MNSDELAVGAAGIANLPSSVAIWSLRRRFALIAVMVVVASSAIGGMAIYLGESAEEYEVRNARLEESGAMLLNLARSVRDPSAFNDPSVVQPHTPSSPPLRFRYQIWSRDGTLLLRAPGTSAGRPLTALSFRGFTTVDVDGGRSRMFALASDDGAFVIQIAESTSEHWSSIEGHVAEDILYLLMTHCVVAGLAWPMLRRGLRAVEATAHQIKNRNPLDLKELRIDDPPEELLPTLGAINSLLAQVDRALSSERQFTAVAAHEMRTPLAGLRAHAQLASAARDDAELHESLQAVCSGVDRVSHLINQLLDLARLDALPAGSAPSLESVNISSVYQATMVDMEAKATGKRTRVSARFEVEVIYGHRGALSILLRNLIDNAILYSPVGSAVEVCCVAHEGGAVLTVDDAGPGIRKADRQAAFERFRRLGQSRVEGVGLGLSIVLSVVELHSARIRMLDSRLGGLRVQVEFPAAPIAADSPG